MFLSFLPLLALVAIVTANVPVGSNWKQLSYGECTKDYKNANPSDPMVAESVQSGSQGKTCNFNPDGPAGLPGLPKLYRDGYLLAASQDLYNGKHTQDNFKVDCDTKKITAADATSGNMCGQTCGECMLVSGDNGSQIFMINEIADIGAVGQNGKGLNFHLDHRHRAEVTPIGSVARNIRFKPVPCPTTGPIKIRIENNWGGWAVYFVAYNYKIGLKAAFILGDCAQFSDPTVVCDPNPVPMPRSWTNRFQWEMYAQTNWDESVYAKEKNVWRANKGDKNTKFIVRLKAVDGQTVDCYGIKASAKGSIFDCVNKNGVAQQFNAQADTTPCGGGGGSPPPPEPNPPPPKPTPPPPVPPPPKPAGNNVFNFNTKWTVNPNKNYLSDTHYKLTTGPYMDGKPVYAHQFSWGGYVYLRYVDKVGGWCIVGKPTSTYAIKGYLAYTGNDPCTSSAAWRIPKETWQGARQYWVKYTDVKSQQMETLWGGTTCSKTASLESGDNWEDHQTSLNAMIRDDHGDLNFSVIALLVAAVACVAVIAVVVVIKRRSPTAPTEEEYRALDDEAESPTKSIQL